MQDRASLGAGSSALVFGSVKDKVFGWFSFALAGSVTVAHRSSVPFLSSFHTLVLSLQTGLMVCCCLCLLDVKEGG